MNDKDFHLHEWEEANIVYQRYKEYYLLYTCKICNLAVYEKFKPKCNCQEALTPLDE